jgi:sulfopyruvate decarboxylase TPP-binding subunit
MKKRKRMHKQIAGEKQTIIMKITGITNQVKTIDGNNLINKTST